MAQVHDGTSPGIHAIDLQLFMPATIHDFRRPTVDMSLWRVFVTTKPAQAERALRAANALYPDDIGQQTAFLQGASLQFRLQCKRQATQALKPLFGITGDGV